MVVRLLLVTYQFFICHRHIVVIVTTYKLRFYIHFISKFLFSYNPNTSVYRVDIDDNDVDIIRAGKTVDGRL